jgi:hypothetical protein
MRRPDVSSRMPNVSVGLRTVSRGVLFDAPQVTKWTPQVLNVTFVPPNDTVQALDVTLAVPNDTSLTFDVSFGASNVTFVTLEGHLAVFPALRRPSEASVKTPEGAPPALEDTVLPTTRRFGRRETCLYFTNSEMTAPNSPADASVCASDRKEYSVPAASPTAPVLARSVCGSDVQVFVSPGRLGPPTLDLRDPFLEPRRPRRPRRASGAQGEAVYFGGGGGGGGRGIVTSSQTGVWLLWALPLCILLLFAWFQM